jgi:hypothetical protein
MFYEVDRDTKDFVSTASFTAALIRESRVSNLNGIRTLHVYMPIFTVCSITLSFFMQL